MANAGVDSWTPWQDFTAERLYDMFRDIIRAEWTIQGSLHRPWTLWDAEVHDEDELEHNILSKYIVGPVNEALAFASQYTGRNLDLRLGRSGKSSSMVALDNRYRPDWALCCHGHTNPNVPDKYISLLPGDSKLSTKWHSSLYLMREHKIWEHPVNQVASYSISAPSRYGFIITDQELVVLRLHTEPPGNGLAANRYTRQAAQQPQTAVGTAAHSRQLSNVTASTVDTVLSANLQNVSLADSSGSYQPSAVIGSNVEYCAIPWDNCAGSGGQSSSSSSKGKGKDRDEPVLTVRLALFYLCWMAASSNEMQESYPELDTYSWSDDMQCFMHNSIARPYTRSGMPRRCQYFNPLARDRGPAFITDDETGEETHLTRASVRTFDIVERDGHILYQYMTAEGQEYLITPDTQVFDEEQNLFGHFVNLVWHDGPYAQRSSAGRKHRSGHSESWASSKGKRR